jgi:hypothetical protein
MAENFLGSSRNRPAFRDRISLRRLPLPLPDEWIRKSVTTPRYHWRLLRMSFKNKQKIGHLKSREQLRTEPPEIPCNIVTHDAAKRLTNQHAVVSGEINGLEVRVLPGSPKTSPKYFPYISLTVRAEAAAAAELRTSENKTPATRSTASLCESETVWVYTLSVVSRSECPSRACAVMRDSPFACRSVAWE